MTFAELLKKVADKATIQVLRSHITNITSTKRGRASKVTFETDAITPTEVATGSGKIGILVWIDREVYEAVLKEEDKSESA